MLWLNVKLHMVTMIVEWLMQKLCDNDRDLQETGFFCVCLDLERERERERFNKKHFKRLFYCI